MNVIWNTPQRSSFVSRIKKKIYQDRIQLQPLLMFLLFLTQKMELSMIPR